MAMRERIEALCEEAKRAADGVASQAELESLRVQYFGKKGSFTQLSRGLGQMPPGERPQAGQWINAARAAAEEYYDARQAALKRMEQFAPGDDRHERAGRPVRGNGI